MRSKILQKSKSLFFTIIITCFLTNSINLMAQDKKVEKENKLDQIKGKVEKITIKADGKEIVIDGDEAEKLVKHLKTFSKAPMIWLSDVDAKDGHKVMQYRFQHGEDADWTGKDGVKKKVEVKIEDGKKKVTVISGKDGKEETKVYEGEEAEKFLKESEKLSGSKFRIQLDDSKDGDKYVYMFKKMCDDKEFEVDGHKVKVFKMKGKDDIDWVAKGDAEKKVKIEINGGKKKVTVTTEKDRKAETKVYEGEEAEKFLKENEKMNGKTFNIKIGDEDSKESDVLFFKKRHDDDEGCCSCCGRKGKKMHTMPFHGQDAKKIIIEKKVEKEEKETKK